MCFIIISTYIGLILSGIGVGFSIFKYKDKKRVEKKAEKKKIYDELKNLIITAGSLITFFNATNKRRHDPAERCETEEQLVPWIQDVYERVLKDDLGLKEINLFYNYIKLNSLSISDSVKKISNEIKTQQMQLYSLVKNKIYTNAYKKDTYDDLIDWLNKADLIIKKLEQDLEALLKQMRKELDPI